MPQTEMRVIGERRFTISADEQEMNEYVGRHGLETAARNVVRLAETLHINPLTLGIAGTFGRIEHPNGRSRKSEQEPVAIVIPEQIYYNRHGEPITEARHNGGLTAWETRRAIDTMLAANPRLSRMAALALYRDEHPRSRAKNLPGPRNNPSKGETSWDTRVRNVIKKHHAATGSILSWQDAHQRALQSLQGNRKAA